MLFAVRVQAHGGNSPPDSLPVHLAGELHEIAQILIPGAVGQEARRLNYGPHPLRNPLAVSHALPQNLNTPLRHRKQAANTLKQYGFPRAVSSDDAVNLPCFKASRHVTHRHSLPKPLGHILYDNGMFHFLTPSPSPNCTGEWFPQSESPAGR